MVIIRPFKKGEYGTKGVSTPTTRPGSRGGASFWTDKEGRFWLFGGAGPAGNESLMNDLWCFQPTSNTWTWVSGDPYWNVPGVYGTKGEGSAANKPGGRTVASGWMGNDNSIWIMGWIWH